MDIQETKNPNRYAAVITYTIAVVFLLAGLFLPLTAGKEILALNVLDVIDAMKSGSKSVFVLAHKIDFLGMGKGTMDVMAWITFMYFIVTAVALIGFIPVGISTKKGTHTASIFAYVVEIAAVLLLSIWLIIELQVLKDVKFSYNLLIALGGTLLMLVILSCINKKGTGGVKVVLFLLSAVAVLMLLDLTYIIPKLGKPLTKVGDALKISPLFYGKTVSVEGVSYTESSIGMGFVKVLFEAPEGIKFKGLLKAVGAAKEKALMVLTLITGLTVLMNFFIDVIGLSTNAKKTGHAFNVARYGLELASVICLFVTAAVCKYRAGLLLIIVLFAVVIQLAVSVARLCRYCIANRTPEQVAEKESRRAERARAREEKLAGAAAANAEDNEQPSEPLVVTPEPAYEAEAAPKTTVTRYPEYTNPYEAPVRPDEQPAEQPRYANPYAAPAAPEQYVNPYATPAQQPAAQPAQQTAPRPRQYVNPYAAQNPAPTPETFPSYTAPQQEPRVYKANTLYQGPTDEFMRKLSNDEKIEFSTTFIEKNKGDIGKVPDYVIGGDNKKFFSSVFIYLGRVRNLISDGLLNKMYKELNMLK